MESLRIQTADGEFVATYSEQGLARLNFPDGEVECVPSDDPVSPGVREWHELTTRALKQVLVGEEPDAFPPMDISSGTEFQRSVWQAMQRIKAGQTLSYGEIAKAIGKPNAVRAVGGACGANPIPVLIPCHRVLAANHKIGGFSGGLHWKRKLLQREQTQILI